MEGSGIGRRSLIGAAGFLLARPAFASVANTKPRVKIVTPRGEIIVELEPVKAPITATNFLRYVDAKKYDGGQFYRASRTPGAPGAGTIQGGPNLKSRLFHPIAHESTTQTGLRHRVGTISMGRYAPGTATANFFICASAQPYLDAHPGAPGDNLGFAAFGQVVDGMPVVRKILALPTGGQTSEPAMKGQILTTPVPIVSMTRMG